VEATTPRGKVASRYIIVTASTNVLAAEKIKFDKGLPKRQIDALAALTLGSFDHIALDLPGNPLGLQRDEVVFERSSGPRTAALLANVSGTSLAVVEIGGKFGRELSAQGDMAMVDFAVEWLTGLFGAGLKRSVQRTSTTRWNAEPWTMGAFSTASPGGQGARRIMTEPVRERVFFAGEAMHETLWGTVGGAWESGERAADAVLRRLAGQPDLTPPPPPEPAAQPRPAAAAAKPGAERPRRSERPPRRKRKR
jgi:monoamine oxidase